MKIDWNEMDLKKETRAGSVICKSDFSHWIS